MPALIPYFNVPTIRGVRTTVRADSIKSVDFEEVNEMKVEMVRGDGWEFAAPIGTFLTPDGKQFHHDYSDLM